MDELINPAVVGQLRDALRAVAPTLGLEALLVARDAVPGARLRRRVDLVRDALLHDLPPGYRVAERVVLEVPRTG